MAAGNKASLPLSGFLAAKDDVGTGHGVAIRSGDAETKIIKGQAVKQLLKFEFHGILPQGVAILAVKFGGFFDTAGNLDSELAADLAGLGHSADSVDDGLGAAGNLGMAAEELPARRAQQAALPGAGSNRDGAILGGGAQWLPSLAPTIPKNLGVAG